MIAHRVFRCLECEQYVVFPSHFPDVTSTCNSIQTLDMPFFETINKSDLSQSSFPYDFNSPQASSDSSNPLQSVVSSSHFPNSLSLFSTDVSHIPFPQVTDLSMSRPVFDSYDTSSYKSRMETDQSDEVALLRSEVERLKDVVQTLQQRYPQALLFSNRTGLIYSKTATRMVTSRTRVFACLHSTVRTWRQWLALILFETRFLVCLLNLRRLHVRETI
jgi:hypothetical protein